MERRGAFEVSWACLFWCGFRAGRGQRVFRATRKTWQAQPHEALPGGVLHLDLASARGKLVYVESVLQELDWSSVSGSIDGDPYFSRDSFGQHSVLGGSAWHAVRVHNMCRPMGSPEACCERAGSLMHALFDGRRSSAGPAEMMDQVLLAGAHVQCLGSPRDEAICQEVARVMLLNGYRPLIATAWRRAHREASGAPSRAVFGLQAHSREATEQSGRGRADSDIESLGEREARRARPLLLRGRRGI